MGCQHEFPAIIPGMSVWPDISPWLHRVKETLNGRLKVWVKVQIFAKAGACLSLQGQIDKVILINDGYGHGDDAALELR